MIWLTKSWTVSFWKKDKYGDDYLDCIFGTHSVCEEFIENTLIENAENPSDNNIELCDFIPQPI